MSNSKSVVHDRPQVVVAVFILKENKFLMGKRTGSIGEGTWCIPGGRLEFGEELLAGARREVLEETGLKAKNFRLGTVVNDYSIKEKWHYATICYVADYDSGIAKIMEPDKCTEWRWVEWDNLPKPLFAPMKLMVDQKFNPFKK